jgi:uncharacterized protein YbaA (DUF1428 family)
METEMVKDGGAAGLVERLRGLSKSLQGLDWCDSLVPDEAADALEAKDAALSDANGALDHVEAFLKDVPGASIVEKAMNAKTTIEAKDAEIETLKDNIASYNSEANQLLAAQAEIEWLKEMSEIERLRELLKGCWQTDTLPRSIEMEIEEALTLAALKGGD